MSFFILVALVKEKPVQQQEIAIISSSSFSDEEIKQPESVVEPTPIDEKPSIKLPEPIVIYNQFDLSKIEDLALRSMVRRKVDFRRQKVLYFVWKGNTEEKMEGKMVDKENIYLITLYSQPEASLMIHKQVFIIPANVNYSLELSQR